MNNTAANVCSILMLDFKNQAHGIPPYCIHGIPPPPYRSQYNVIIFTRLSIRYILENSRYDTQSKDWISKTYISISDTN